MTQAQQLSLWDVEEQQQDLPQSIADQCKGHIVVRKTWWADGDTRPEQMDRLALSMLEEGTEVLKRCDGVSCVFRIISSAAIDGYVHYACEYQCTLTEFFGGKETGPCDNDDEDY